MGDFRFGEEMISSRDIRSRVHDIEIMRDEDDPTSWDPDETAEHEALTALLTEINAPDSRWEEITLIHECHFTAYIREEYQEIGPQLYEETANGPQLLSTASLYGRHPFSCIDWDAVAEIEARDYAEITIDGHLYYYQEP